MKKIVVALGGNAIQANDNSATAQQKAVQKTMKVIAQMIEQGDQVAITHGNGPQVGNLLLQQHAGASKDNPAMPLDTISAMTQGSIGYWMQKALDDQLHADNYPSQAVTLVTQTIVAADDPAFNNPTKPIGPFYDFNEMQKQQIYHPDYRYKQDAGRGYRQVVPSPKPVEIVNAPIIRNLLKNHFIPIACGGGGIPVIVKDGHLRGVAGVIDKDFSAAKMAEDINADELVILTTVDHAFLNYGKENQQAIGKIKVEQLKQYLAAGYFAAGSMKPKIEAAIEFVEKTGNLAIITSLSNANKLADGVGTIVYN
ncbi:MAG: carbamate kinase [Lactobacillus crispatus]|nr:carbamate kinase [Lactobacillus crispatus]MCI1335532.1 carbamate kinase [Lactobacillus crispatus]MCI1364259.1 carbamate kinase [Lactobacillus crispatus]MCI1525321.1 carbamate kinase [Lactobacillus crispatus]MCI1537513.1 carbamate kinase [Lactobacillus crispatus]